MPGWRGAEIGVNKGEFAALMLSYGRPSKLYLVDPWDYQPAYPNSIMGREGVDQSVMDTKYDYVVRRFTREIISGVVEIIRDYSSPAANLETYQCKVKPGGLIMGDDYRRDTDWGLDVIRAWNEFMADRRLPLLFMDGKQIALVNSSY